MSGEMTGLTVLLLLIPFAAAQDGLKGGSALFTKCGNKLCYEVTVKKMIVQMGPDGTNDDVSAKICTDDGKTCCTTPAIKALLSNDWSKNDLEEWGPKYFGDCKDTKFKISNGLQLTLNKTGKDSLAVNSLFLDAEVITNEGKKADERFECGQYVFGGKNGTNSSTIQKFCKTSPYTYERLHQINVDVGTDGTGDTVSVELCSDVNNVCCKAPMKRLISSAFVRNSAETWKEGDLPECRGIQYKVLKSPTLTLYKNGKDTLKIKKFSYQTVTPGDEYYNYDCGQMDLGVAGQDCGTSLCQLKKVCTKTKIAAPKRTQSTTTKPPFRLG